MTYTMRKVDTYTFEVINASGGVEYRGPLETAMRECSRLNLAAKGPAKSSTKEQKRQERREAGRR